MGMIWNDRIILAMADLEQRAGNWRNLFPPCQWSFLDFIRVAFSCVLNRELHISVGAAGPQGQTPNLSGHCQTSTAISRSQWGCRSSTASSRSQWALPDLNGKLQISVGTAGPQPRSPDLSGHCRASTASSRSQRALPDLNCELQISLGTARPQPRAPDLSGHCQTSSAISRS